MSLTKLGPYDVGPNRIDLAEWINTPSGDKFLASFSGTSGSILVSAQAEGILEGTFTFNGRQSDNSAIKTITN